MREKQKNTSPAAKSIFFCKRITVNEASAHDKFYKFTAALLPAGENAKVLDLGCGTGLELEEFFLVKEALIAAGFTKVEVLNHWEATYTLKAGR